MSATLHQPVLLQDAVQALVTNPRGHYVDCTYGRGGHSRALVAELEAEGRLMVIDRDPLAIAHARNVFAKNPRVTVVHDAFSTLRQHVCAQGLSPLDGVLLDLGVSSPQFDEPERGFSFSRPGPLDMRMNPQEGETAAQWLSRAAEEEIIEVLKNYGEEKYARRIARKIIETRQLKPIQTTSHLADIVKTAVPSRAQYGRAQYNREHGKAPQARTHPATKTFQAIRIHINQELQELEACLADIIGLLNSGGRIVIISFHSLEDRLVKRFFRNQARGGSFPSRLPLRENQLNKTLRLVGKPIRASALETHRNRRARSSIMRVAEKL